MNCFENEGVINTNEFKEALDCLEQLELSCPIIDFYHRALSEFEDQGQLNFQIISTCLQKIEMLMTDDFTL